MSAVKLKSGPAADALSDLIELIRAAVYDQENLIGLALTQVYKSDEHTDTLLKSAMRVNADLFDLYQKLDSLAQSKVGAA